MATDMSLESVISNFNKSCKQEVIRVGLDYIDVPRIPTGIPRLDYMTYGGIPRGHVVEFNGTENGGKTTTAVSVCAQAQKLFQKEWEDELAELREIKKPTKEQTARITYLENRGPLLVLFIDSEHSFDEDWAQLQGMDTDSTVFIKPYQQSAEQVLQVVLDCIDTGEIGLAVLDSIATLVSKQAMEKTLEEKTYGGISGVLATFSPKLANSCAKTGCAFIGINQLRDDLSNPYGGTKTTGGRAWRHICLGRFAFRKGRFVDSGNKEVSSTTDSPAGNIVQVSVEKTKYFKPNRRLGQFIINYTSGMDTMYDYIQLGIQYQVIIQSGAWFTFMDPATGEVLVDSDGKEYKVCGIAALPDYIQSNEVVYNVLNTVLQNLFS
ncbi:MAG: hypothetical protein IJA19_00255 [Clostridia bacterium]|nr:hypothetical protein [Clostridia bacterium]